MMKSLSYFILLLTKLSTFYFYKQSGNEVTDAKMKSADLEDALADFNSAEIKDAMADSDLKGLTQIKSALDEQNTKNSVEFFNQNKQPMHSLMSNSNISEISLTQLSEEFKEAERGYDIGDLAKTKGIKVINAVASSVPEKPQKDAESVEIKNSETAKVSKDSTSKDTTDSALETIKQITENAEQFFVPATKNDKINDKSKKEEKVGSKRSEDIMKAASLVQTLIKQDSKDGNEEATDDEKKKMLESDKSNPVDDALIGRIMNSKAFQRFFEADKKKSSSTTDKDHDLSSAITGSTRSSSPSYKWREIGSNALSSESLLDQEPMDSGASQAYKAFVKSVHEEALNGDKLKGSEGTLESFKKGDSSKLRIHGGKVLGGSVRGGNIAGGEISGGDVSGGEVDGGKITGGSFKGGQLIGGSIRNGVVEGGKIRGGKIEGGLLRSGLVDGGVIRGGIIEGGHLVNGTVDGGDFKGGEMLGGRLSAGEIDGGILKGGEVAGGILKGGVIESGRLEGGVMLSGLLRGGIIKSGIIKGGIIDQGVIVQGKAEIGPGVEIHEGTVKGGRITASHSHDFGESSSSYFKDEAGTKRTNTPTMLHRHTTVNRSNIFHIELQDANDGEDAVDFEKGAAYTHGSKSYVDEDGFVRDRKISSSFAKKDDTKLEARVNDESNDSKLSETRINPAKSSVPQMRPRVLSIHKPSNADLLSSLKAEVGGTKRHLPAIHLYDPSVRNRFFAKKPSNLFIGSQRGVQVGVRRQIAPLQSPQPGIVVQQFSQQPQQQQSQVIQQLAQPQQQQIVAQQSPQPLRESDPLIAQLKQQVLQQYAKPNEENGM